MRAMVYVSDVMGKGMGGTKTERGHTLAISSDNALNDHRFRKRRVWGAPSPGNWEQSQSSALWSESASPLWDHSYLPTRNSVLSEDWLYMRPPGLIVPGC